MTTATTSDLITCRVGDELIGLPLDCVHEINRMVTVTPVPRSAPEIRGLINLRGSLVTILDLSRFLAQRPCEVSPTTRSVIVEWEGDRYGLLVDAVGDVVECKGRALEPLPTHTPAARARWSTGLVQHDDDVLLVLDIAAVLRPRDEDQPGQAGSQ